MFSSVRQSFRVCLFLLGAGGLIPLAARGLTDPAAAPFLIRSWQTDQGLPNNTVNAVTQTHDGYLWLGTENGLVRFDGVNYRKYGLPEGLGSLQVTALAEDRAGALWIGTDGGGVSRLKDGRMETFTVKNGLAGNSIHVLLAGTNGDIWAGTPTGLSRWHAGKFALPGPEVAAAYVYDLAQDHEGNIWIATLYEGLLRYHDGKISRAGGETGTNITNNPRCVMVDNQDRVWAGFRELRVGCLDKGVWTMYGTNEGMPEIVFNRMAQTAADGTIWVASLNDGLFYLKDGRFHALQRQEGLADDAILAVHTDAQFLWVGTQSGGLCRIGPRKLFVYHVMDGLSEVQLRSLAEPTKDDLWVATYGQGIFHWNGREIEDMLGHPFHDHVIVEALLGGRDGSLWWGTGGTIDRWLAGKWVFKGESLFKGDRIWSLCEDRSGAMWVGTHNGQLHEMKHTGTVNIKGLPDRPVTSLVQASDGTLWIGSLGGGLGRLHNGKLTLFTTKDGLPSNLIRTLHLDADQTLWIGTDGGGLARLAQGKLFGFTSEQGLLDDSVLQILEDDDGNLWLGGYRGICRVYKRALTDVAEGRTKLVHTLVFGRSDGMASEACVGNFGAALKMRSGQLLFSTEKGIVAIDPRHQVNSVVPPTVLLEDMLADGVTLTNGSAGPAPVPAGPASIFARAITPPAGLRLAPGRHLFEFHYTGISFDSPERVQFQCQLEGLDPSWIPEGGDRVARYSSVPPGRYRFLVKASSGNDQWSAVAAGPVFEVLPHFWQTMMFRTGLAVALLAALGLMIRYVERRRYKLRLKRLEQEQAMERERGRIARDLHDELGSSLTYISMSVGDLVRSRGGDTTQFMNRLKKISGFAVRTSRSLDEIVWAVNPHNDSVRSLVEYLTQLARELFEDSGVHCRFLIAADLPALALPPDLRHNVFLAVKEALNNTLKHAGATEICLGARADADELELTIQDNGKGFDLTAGEASPGHDGLKNMRQRIEAVGGQFTVISQPGQGTTIRLRVRFDSAGRPGAKNPR